MREDKQQKVDNFKNWLIEQDIQFIERINGHFQIYNDYSDLCYQVWATTEKMLSNLTDDKHVGMARIQRILTEWRNSNERSS